MVKAREAHGWAEFARRHMTGERLAALETLQRRLLENGFRLLRPGGRLVYSTCSLAKRQNEDIVRWFLGREPRAQMVPTGLDLAAAGATAPADPLLQHALKFNPLNSGTSGLFVACLTKTAGSV